MRVDLFLFLRFSYRFSLLFLSLSLSSYFPFYWAFISYFCFGLAYSLRQAGLFEKGQVKVDFQISIFQVFSVFESFWCPHCMWFRTDTTDIQGQGMAHTKKSTLIESLNKWGCGDRSKSHCQQLRKNTLRRSKGYGWDHKSKMTVILIYDVKNIDLCSMMVACPQTLLRECALISQILLIECALII